MVWAVLASFLSASIFLFFGRILFFLFGAYPRIWVTVIFLLLLFGFHLAAGFLFPYSQELYGGRLGYFLRNHVILLSLPVLFAVSMAHLLCLWFLRGRANHYSWEGVTLTIYNGDGQVMVWPQDILRVTSVIYPLQPAWGNPMKLFRVKTAKGTFSFDEALEKHYWEAGNKVSFWSLAGGAAQMRRNSEFTFGKARATAYFQENCRR